MKAWLQSILLLRDDKQQVVTNGYPYLRVDSIAGCAVKGLDMQMLLDPLEEDLYLPLCASPFCQLYRLIGDKSRLSVNFSRLGNRYRENQTSHSLYLKDSRHLPRQVFHP